MTSEEEIKIVDDLICKSFGINPPDLRRKCRSYPFGDARQLAWKILKEKYGYKTCELARLYERDHGAVSYGVKAISGRMDYDVRLQSKYKFIKGELKRGNNTTN
jgi:chromosomal replication initiation ATPase DnaA